MCIKKICIMTKFYMKRGVSMFTDRIQLLLNEKGVSASAMAKDLGFSSGLFTQWKQGKQKPSSDKVAKMAEYFNCSIDYILDDSLGDDLCKIICELSAELNVPYSKLKEYYLAPIVKAEPNKNALNKENLRCFFVKSIEKEKSSLSLKNDKLLADINDLSPENFDKVIEYVRLLKQDQK